MTKGSFDLDFIANYGISLDQSSIYWNRVFSIQNLHDWKDYLFGFGNTGCYAYETNIQFNLQLGFVGFTGGISLIEADDGLGVSANWGWADGFDVPNFDINSLTHASKTTNPLVLNDFKGASTRYSASTTIFNVTSGGNASGTDIHFKGVGNRYTTIGSGLNIGFNDFWGGATIDHTNTAVSRPIIRAK
jgi:hypothetical protein